MIGVKPFLQMAWEMVSRWEALEPTKHRCLVPLPIVKAICWLAYAWDMRRFCGITLISFFGLARVGEVLRCRRKDLLLPADLLEEQANAVYLCFPSSKTASRGRSRIQHTKVVDKAAIGWIELIFGDLPAEALLWPHSPAAFRYRWNLLLRWLGIPKGLALTPGGLRGGGAVHRYRGGASLGEIQWVMRLKQVATLEHYLQELAAVTALTEVPPNGRSRIRAAAALFDLANAARLVS